MVPGSESCLLNLVHSVPQDSCKPFQLIAYQTMPVTEPDASVSRKASHCYLVDQSYRKHTVELSRCMFGECNATDERIWRDNAQSFVK